MRPRKPPPSNNGASAGIAKGSDNVPFCWFALFTSRPTPLPSNNRVICDQLPVARLLEVNDSVSSQLFTTSSPGLPNCRFRLSPHVTMLAPGIQCCGFIQSCRVVPLSAMSLGRTPNETRPFLWKLMALFVTCAVLQSDARNINSAMAYFFIFQLYYGCSVIVLYV